MDYIVAIGATIIGVLTVFVVLLTLKLIQYKKRCNKYEVLANSDITSESWKYVPQQTQQTRIPINRDKLNSHNRSHRVINNRIEGLLNVSNSNQKHSHKDLISGLSLRPDNTVGSSRTDAELSLNHIISNNSDEIEISEFESSNNELPAIDFKLVYISQTTTLKVHIKRVSNLPVQFRKNCSSYVKISLITDSEKLSSYHTNVIKKSLNPEYEEDFTFSSLQFEDLLNLTIRICVYVKRKQLSKRQLVGDLWVPLSRPDLEPDIELICNEKLSLACPQTGKRGPLLMVGKLGFLFLQIQYQPEAERLKVLIRKAQNLYNKSISYSNFQITKPEYYVIINVLQNNETQANKETKSAVGVSPVWNQPFIFDVKDLDIKKIWIQCLVMQGKSYTKDGVIGQALIGPNTTVSGIQHWNDVMNADLLELAKWHPILTIKTDCL